MKKVSGITAYDYGRVVFAVIVPVLISLQTGLNKFYVILGAVILVYGGVSLFVAGYSPSAKKFTKLFIIADTLFISLPLFLGSDSLVFNSLYLVQLVGILISFGLPEVLTVFYFQVAAHVLADIHLMQKSGTASQANEFITISYFLLVVFLLSKGWEKERKANRESVKRLNKKIQNIRDVYEISRFLSSPDLNLSISQLISRVTLHDIEVDAGIVFSCDNENFTIEAVLKLPGGTGQSVTDHSFIMFLRELLSRGEPLIVNDINKMEYDLSRYQIFSETLKKFKSVFIYPSLRNDISLIIIVFSKQKDYFTGDKIEVCQRTFNSSMFTLTKLSGSDLFSDSNLLDEEEKLYNSVSALLVRLFRADKCLISLFNDGERLVTMGSFGDRKLSPGTELAQRDQLSVPINSGNKILGYITLINKHAEDFIQYECFNTEDRLLLASLANQISLTIENRMLFKGQKDTLVTTISSLVKALDARDPYTKGHSEQVALYAVMIAKEMGLSEVEIENIRFAGLLHDIGKIGVPEKILNKSGRLTPNEYNQIKMHSYISAQILKPVPLFKPMIPFVYHHHERWDGKGYPDGLRGEEIPLGARILAVADAFDAIISERVYRQGKSKDSAINELVRCAASQFDPRVVDALLTGLEKQLFEEKVDSVWKFDNLSNIFKDVINAVISGQLVISDEHDITGLKQEGEKIGEIPVRIPEDIGKARLAVKETLKKYGVSEQEINKILLCVSEVTTNMIKHASGGRLSWYMYEDCKIRLVAEDSGPGLKLNDLPKATLINSPKKKKAMGLGFTIFFELLNRVYLQTGDCGTTVVLEQKVDCSNLIKAGEISNKVS